MSSALRTRLMRAISALGLGLALAARPAQGQVSPDVVGTTTPQILTSTLQAFPSCVQWRLTGVCFFLHCTPFGCSIRTSIKVSHYVPDAIVSSYNDPLNHPWTDVGKPLSSLLTGAGSTLIGSRLDASATTAREEKEIVTFKTTDAIGNPLAQFLAMASGAGDAAMPATVPIPGPDELMKFPTEELPRILQAWATVPAQVANTMANDARALAANPGSLLSGITSLPSQFMSVQTPMGSLGEMMSGGLNTGFMGGGSGGGSGGGGGGFGLDSSSLQSAITAVGGGEGGDLFCPGGTSPFGIYYQSDLDSWFWRSVFALDLLYPQAWIPGFGEVGNMLTNTWGNLYPRTGELVQSHPAKSSAVLSARVQSILSKPAQAHIYRKFETPGGYKFFAKFADPRWQPLHPVRESSCLSFGTNDSIGPLAWRDFKTSSTDGYIWNLWQRYECCRSRGAYLFSVP